MSLQVGELHALLRLDDKPFQRGISSSKGMLKGVGIAAAAASAATVAALGAAAVKGVQEFAGLQRGMNEVFTLLPGISKDAMDRMTGQVREFATDFGVLPDEVVPALYQSLSAGVPQGNVFDFLETANQAAVGGVTDLTTAVDGISSVVNAYGDQIGGAGEASDLMFTAVRLGKTTFEELSASLSNVTPIAAANNVAFSDVTAALATMTAQGIPTAQATTQIRQAIVELSDAGTGVGETFEKVAGKSFRTFMEEGGTLGEALAMLEGEAAKSGITVDQMFGSVEAGGAALALGGANADNYAAAVEAMGESAGATEGAYNQMDQGLSRSWDRIKAAGAVLMGHLGEELAPAFESLSAWVMDNMPAIQQTATDAFRTIGAFVTEMLIPAFQGLLAWWDENGPTIVATAQTLAAGLTDVFTWINDAVTTVTDWLEGAFGSSGKATGTLGGFAATLAGWGEQIVAILGSAFDAIQGLFSFLVEFTTWIWNNWGEDLIRLVKGNWEMIKGIIDGALDVIQGVFEIFAGIFTGDWERLWDGVKQVADGLWNAIQALWDGLWNQFAVIFNIGADIMKTVWAKLWTDIKTTFTQIRDQLVETWEGFWATLRAVFDSVTAALSLAWEMWTTAIATVWTSHWDGVRSEFETAWGALRGIYDTLTGSLSDAWDTFTNTIGDTWDNLWSGISDGFSTVRTNMEGLISGLVDSLSGIWDGIRNALGAPVNWIADNVINRLIGGVNTVSQALTNKNVLDKLPSPMVTFHEGGIIGRDGRMTGGPLRAGERIVKAQDGEEVLTVDDPRHQQNASMTRLFAESDVAPIGGPFDWIKDVAGDLLSKARDLIAKTVRPLIEGLMGPIQGMAGTFGLPGQIVAGAGSKLVDQALEWISGTEEAVQANAGVIKGSGWRALVDFMAQSGVPHVVTSTYRPGDPGAHGSGRAADFSIGGHGNRGYGSPGLKAIWDVLLPSIGQMSQMILGGAPTLGGKNPPGAWRSPGQAGNHWNHVHAALAKGGLITTGGRFLVGERGPELLDIPVPGSRVLPLDMPGDPYAGGKTISFGDVIVPDREAVAMLRHDMEFAMEELGQ